METIRIGIFADIQYADRPHRIGRYYRNAIKKAQACIDAFNASETDFCVHMGDLIDWPGDPENGRKAMNDILSVTRGCRSPLYYLLGNHDVASLPREELRRYFCVPGESTWYSFDCKGVHFIVLDSNFDRKGVPYRPGYEIWDQCCLPPEEIAWLREDLAFSPSVLNIVFIHALLDDFDNPHVVRNANEVRDVLEHCGKKVTVFQGHMHTGHESTKNGISYHTLPAIVDGRTKTCRWIVEIRQNKVLISRTVEPYLARLQQ